MSNDAKFVGGMRVYAPRENAPEFVIANIVVNVREFREWLAQFPDEVRIDIKKSRGGKFYAVENDYKPVDRGVLQQTPRRSQSKTDQAPEEFSDDVPF